MSTRREHFRADSNNAENPNKNICGLRVLEALGVADQVRFVHVMDDVVRAARKRFTVRSRMSAVGKGKTVGAARKKLAEVALKDNVKFFLVRVDGHVLLLDRAGNTVVDTAPRKRDRRKMTHCFAVM